MRTLFLVGCLVYFANSSQAQTSLRVNLLGPMPVIEQHFLPRHSVELAYAPTAILKEWYFDGNQKISLSSRRIGYYDPKASTAWIGYRYYEPTEEGDLNQKRWTRFFSLYARWSNVEYKKSSVGLGQDELSWQQTQKTTFGGGIGFQRVARNGLTFDLFAGVGFGTVNKKTWDIFFSELSGINGTDPKVITTIKDATAALNGSVSIGYTIHPRDARD
jgi:hypothetical protein